MNKQNVPIIIQPKFFPLIQLKNLAIPEVKQTSTPIFLVVT